MTCLTMLQWIARVAAYFLGTMGWFLFFWICFYMASHYLGPEDRREAAYTFKVAGSFLTQAWFLFRFAAGLFPFGNRVFQ